MTNAGVGLSVCLAHVISLVGWPKLVKLFFFFLQYLEGRNKGRVVAGAGRDSRQGLDVAYLAALTTSAKLAEEELRIQNHFISQTMSLKVSHPTPHPHPPLIPKPHPQLMYAGFVLVLRRARSCCFVFGTSSCIYLGKESRTAPSATSCSTDNQAGCPSGLAPLSPFARPLPRAGLVLVSLRLLRPICHERTSDHG